MTHQSNPPLDKSADVLPVPKPRTARLRVGFLSPHNPFDRRTFSGTPYFAANALGRRTDIDLRILGSYRKPRRTDRLKARVFGHVSATPEPDRLDLSDIDMVLGLVATSLLDRMRTHHTVPFLHVTDATPDFLRKTYGWDIPDDADALERRVARSAAAAIYSSDYMAVRANREFGADLKALSVPFGVNLEVLPDSCPRKPFEGPVEILFVCSDWRRKGGDTVLATLDVLRARGIDARLTVVGRIPDSHRDHPAMTCTGYLNKNRPEEAARLAGLYRAAHLMLLPTRGDCTPMVVAEALAHGTPVLASALGGMATLLPPGTGGLLDVSASAEDWAEAAQWLIADPADYAETSQRAFLHARDNLTWDSWAGAVANLAWTLRQPALAA